MPFEKDKLRSAWNGKAVRRQRETCRWFPSLYSKTGSRPLLSAVSAQAQKPTTGYAPVNGLKMYCEIHGSGRGEPLVLRR